MQNYDQLINIKKCAVDTENAELCRSGIIFKPVDEFLLKLDASFSGHSSFRVIIKYCCLTTRF